VLRPPSDAAPSHTRARRSLRATPSTLAGTRAQTSPPPRSSRADGGGRHGDPHRHLWRRVQTLARRRLLPAGPPAVAGAPPAARQRCSAAAPPQRSSSASRRLSTGLHAKPQEMGHLMARTTALEVNATFYRSQTPDTFRRWVAAAAAASGGGSAPYLVALKGPRYITHMKRLARPPPASCFACPRRRRSRRSSPPLERISFF